MSDYKFKVVSPTCTGTLPTLQMALALSDTLNKAGCAPIYIYAVKDTK